MTRATLLHVLDHTSAIGLAEVRELEQLAQAFPYCQTAHLLLAKAAHDQGTMLAGQRLRRAATYAADRTLLRRLIEQIDPVAVEIPPIAPAATQSAAFEVAPPVVPQPLAPEPAAPEPVIAERVIPEALLPAAVPVAPAPPAVLAAEQEEAAQVAAPVSVDITPEPVAATPPAPLPAVELPQAEEISVPEYPKEESGTTPEAVPQAEISPVVEEPDASLLLDVEGVEILAAEPVQEIIPAEVAAPEEDLPAQAPAIRPPVEVGEARFEFGLADAPPLASPTYELPGLVDEWAASAVTRSLGSLEPIPEVLAHIASDATQPALTPAAFTGDEAIGYGFGESSRLGFSMQLLNLLTDKAMGTSTASDAIAAAQPPATPLPPAGTFFEPDPLLLDHWATHCPPAPALPSSLDLINNFLRRQPRLTRPAMLPPTAGAQADLSVRSTRPEADLVSDSLARILVRQGKTARAIEIYEKLMVRQPEKMAYFAAQIQSLQPPA
ncbi:hypothetical protein [Hymenobacter glacialis]|uniref:Uncharacterized protein n=1 Tax=Hymenobacter glacialis TaxID=1908236 RepID=A0A1G1TDG1_9BACT|nr:hypothetical protein [Hymenobacter glacialis]OGX88913.1 hypothetical protein BEN48_08195 [Hymenobacter glacialis]